MRGYLRNEGTRKRLRIVKAGYDAESSSVPFDAVLFDSDSDGMASYLDSGVYTIPQGSSNFVALTEGVWIKTWSYPFVPLCMFQFNAYGFGWSNNARALTAAGATGTRLSEPEIRVTTSGIWVRGAFDKGNGINFQIKWVAFRIAAT